MPFTHVAIPDGTPPADKAAIARGVHEAMVAALGIPDDDFFQMVCEYQPGDFLFDRGFLGVQRSDRVVVIRITLRRGRSDAMKRDLYARVAANSAGTRTSAHRTCSSTWSRTIFPTGRSAAGG